jgi:hypothetical protein
MPGPQPTSLAQEADMLAPWVIREVERRRREREQEREQRPCLEIEPPAPPPRAPPPERPPGPIVIQL